MFKISGSVKLTHTQIIPSYNRYFQVKEQNRTRDLEIERRERREKKGKMQSAPGHFRNFTLELLVEGVNGVNLVATKGKKILLTTDKTRKQLLTSDKKFN